MSNLISTLLGQLRIITFAEGMSYLILLFIAMPLKYLADFPQAVAVFGMIHGVLFVLYIGYVLVSFFVYRWSIGKTLILLLVSILPFGNFWADRRYLNHQVTVEA